MPELPGIKHHEIVDEESEKCPVTAFVPEKPKKVEIAEKKPVIKKKKPEPEINTVKEVFKPSSIDTDELVEAKGNIKIAEAKDEYLPALRMDISDYETTMGAVRYFGMKIALLDKLGNFVDEIRTVRAVEIVPIEESLSEYSNRIRMLPASYFGKRAERIIVLRELTPCVLIPADIDKGFADLQKSIVSRQGYELEEVRATAGRFVRTRDRYRLVIERLYLNNGGEELL